MSEQVYYYSRDRQTREGPVSVAEMRGLAQNGVLTREHLVWTDGMGEWSAAGTIPGVFGEVPPPIPAMTPPTAPGDWVWEEPEYAGFWLRFVAAIIDGLILMIPTWSVSFLIAGILGVPLWNTRPAPISGPVVAHFMLTFVVNTVIVWLYFALMESSANQATVGKMALGLRVTSESLERLTFGRATGRFFAKMISRLTLYIGFIMAGFTERKQALHDLIAGCLVVRKR